MKFKKPHPLFLLSALLSILFSVISSLSYNPTVTYPAGRMVTSPPTQINNSPSYIFTHGDFDIEALAEFSMEGKVLSKERYRVGSFGTLVPYDFVMGWNGMSNEAVLEKINISQGGRWYKWRTLPDSLLSISDIIQSSANMHMIPSNDKIRKTLKDIKEGEIIYVKGKLVEAINRKDRGRMKSSLTRSDKGAGACEVIFIEELKIIKKPNRKVSLF